MRHPTSTSFITPIKSDGVEQTESATEFGRGSFTLTAGATYYYPIGGQDCPNLSAHMHWDAAIVITSITVEDCDMPPGEVSDYVASTGGQWIDEDPAAAFVGVKGAGVTVTSGVVAAAGGALGGCLFHISTGARRTRLAVVVGATGGEMRCAAWGKE